jgi:hypothetical protein
MPEGREPAAAGIAEEELRGGFPDRPAQARSRRVWLGVTP